MARTYVPEVNHHVTYFDANSKPVSATITAVGSVNGGIVLRIGRSGIVKGNGTTGILRVAFNHASSKANTWTPA